MIDRLIQLSLRNRFLVVAFFLLVGGWGYWALLPLAGADADRVQQTIELTS